MKKNMKNKKGAEMTIGTIIVIILALVVLVILVYGFSTSWTNLWAKITGFGGGKVNVQTEVQSCQLACTTGSQYDYCKTRKLIEADSEGKVIPARDVTCKVLEAGAYGLDTCDINCGSSGTGSPTKGELEAWQQKCQTANPNAIAKIDCSADKRAIQETVSVNGKITYCCSP